MCFWELRLCHDNPVINRSCYFENALSTLAIDVPGATDKPGTALIQYTHNNRFNQRFNIYRKGIDFVIENLHSKLYLTIKGNSSQPGAQIVQSKISNKEGQRWKI